MRPLWLYLHFPHIQLDSLCDSSHAKPANPSALGECQPPVIILHAQSNTVMQLNRAAEATGIQRGMGLGTAAALAQKLQVLPYQPEVEERKLTEIAEHLYLITSDICLYPPNGILLRIHNMLSLYGGLQGYWQALAGQLSYFDIHYHYATGQSPLAAQLLARTGWDQVTDHYPMLKHQIGLRELADTKLNRKTIAKLDRVGIRHVHQLMAICLKDIAKRFDIDLVTYLGRLTGEFHHPVNFFHPQAKFDRYTELLYEISHSDTLLPPMTHLLAALEQFLKVRDLLTQQIRFTLYLRDADNSQLIIGSAQPEYQTNSWRRLTELKLDNLRLTSAVYALSLTTGDTQLRTPDRADLFSASKGTLSYLQLISLLQAKLGENSVQRIGLRDDYRPEQVNDYSSPQQQVPRHGDYFAQPLRPSFLLPCPQRLSEKVTVIRGPERINTGWWDNQTIIRDYFIALNQQQQWLWVYRTPESQWFVHGLFS